MNSVCKYPTLAKPSGITLEQHTLDVIREGEILCGEFVSLKYYKRINKNLKERLTLICKFHDIGKKTDRWQVACQKDYEEYIKDPLSFVGENLRTVGIRHELYSAIEAKRVKMPLSLIAAIAAHHGKMTVASEERWQIPDIKEIWGELKRLSWQQLSIEEIISLQYEYSSLRSLLQFADHRASAKEEGDYVPELKPFRYKFPHSSMRPVQKLIADNWQKDLLLLRR